MRKNKTQELHCILATLFVLALSLLFVPNFVLPSSQGDNLFHVYLCGEEVGVVDSKGDARACYIRARRKIAKSSDEMIFINAKPTVEGEEVFWGRTDSDETVVEKMVQVLSDHEERSLEHCYTLKIGSYTVNLQSESDVTSLLQTVLDQYDPDHSHVVSLARDASRKLTVLTTQILSSTEQKEEEAQDQTLPLAGIEQQLSAFFDAVQPAAYDLDDFATGLKEISFEEKIEVCEAYMPANQITSLQDAVANVEGDALVNTTYEVQNGDTLSGIAEKFSISVDDLIAMNTNLESENSTILPGDNLVVTVSQPKLSVDCVMAETYEEDYTADTIYKDNDSWYTTKSKVIQEAVTGRRRVLADVTYQNGTRTGSTIVRQETIKEAVPEIIERGTQSPPTFIWPVSSGYVSSGFGARSRPKAGASTYHQGVDIAVSIGTTVRASSGGTVITAGWVSGYGNAVYIRHADGVVTRYGHLSKILVSVGETVTQGERIALSGNTGNSTGPHLHFEMRINGTAVNPLNYISY